MTGFHSIENGRRIKALVAVAALCLVGLAYPATPGHAQDLSVSTHQSPPGNRGTKIAFTRTENALPGTEDSPLAEIWVMNWNGTGRRQLTHNNTFDLGAVWSPDGGTIAFYSVDDVAGPHVFLIPVDGGPQRPLTVMQSRFPSWSATGKIAFDNGGPTGGDIYVINPDGSGSQQLTTSFKARNIRPDWSPNGDKIAFTSRREGNDEIYVMNADGSDPTRLTNNPASDNAPAWSPDGTKIAFQSNRDGNTEIYTMNPDGTDQTRVTNYPGRDQDPDWSPDGQKIIFERDAQPIANLTLQLFVMNADGTDPIQLTGLGPNDHSENNHPGWGPRPLAEP
jgi:Tol biopolymer transport system component